MKGLIIGLFIVLFLGSLFFSLERILFSDSSFILFRIINQGILQPQEHRYGSFITQGFPLIAVKLHLPLSWIVFLYSASFNLFYLAVILILVLRFKEYSLAILMSFYFLLFVSDSYFWVNNEVHQGITWMFLFFGITLYLLKKNVSLYIVIPFFLILAFLSIYTHPLVLFPILFLWLFFLLQKEKGDFTKPATIILSVILIVVCISKFFLSAKTDHYDSDKLHVITHISFTNLFHALFSPMAKEIFKRSFTNYWLVPVLFLAGIYSAIKIKKYKQVILATAFCLAYFIAVCLTYQGFAAFYTESELMPATIIATAPFVYYVIPALKQKTTIIILTGIFLIRLVYIGIASEKFTERKNWLFATLKITREKNIRKGIIYNNEIKNTPLFLYWATPEESIIASALSKDKPNLTFVVGWPDDISQRLPKDSYEMISAYGSWGIHSTNTRYFSFDTTASYQVMTPMNIQK